MEILTPHRRYQDWSVTLLDRTYCLPATYDPPNRIEDVGVELRAFVFPNLYQMMRDARLQGILLHPKSGFRSYSDQQTMRAYWIQERGLEWANLYSALPGHSEHQLGTTVDIGDENGLPWDTPEWDQGPTARWLRGNAHRYGFLMTHVPDGSSGLGYEPWHFRFVGPMIAAKVVRANVSLATWLRRYTLS